MTTINKKYSILITFFAIILFSSCTDSFFDVKKKDSLNDDTFWQTENHANLALTGCYNEWEDYTNLIWMDMAGGNGYSQYPWDGFQAFGNGTLNATSDQANLFSYELTRKCNNFLEKIETVNMDKAKKERYKAEVRFLRAYDYFRRTMYYGDCPLVTKTIKMPADANLPRNPRSEVVQFIINELTEIAKILPVQNDIESGGHITAGAAYALKARLLLFEKDYDGAIKAAQNVINMKCYELFPNDYLGIFSPDTKATNKENILAIQYVRDYYSQGIWQHTFSAADGGWSSVTVAKNLVDAYEMANGLPITNPASGYNEDKQFENRDPRFYYTIRYPGKPFNGRIFNTIDPQIKKGTEDIKNPDYWDNPNAPQSGLSLNKYTKLVPTSDFWNGDANVPVIRLAEVYLTYAEAAEKVGTATQRDSALMLINKIRSRAGHVPATALTEDLVRRERRVELCFEGLWYFDVARWDLGKTELGKPLYGTGYGTVNMTTGEVTWKKENGKIDYKKLEDRTFFPKRKYLFMIPQGEMDANPQMTQNEGY